MEYSGLFQCLFIMALLCEYVYGGWNFWTEWTTCPIPCEGKSKWRRRTCRTQFCNGNYFEYEYCEPWDCLVTPKLIKALRQQQNVETSSLTSRTAIQQSSPFKPSTGLGLLNPSTSPSYTSTEFEKTRHVHVSLSVTNSSEHHRINDVNKGETSEHTKTWLTTTLTSTAVTPQPFRDFMEGRVRKTTPPINSEEKDNENPVLAVAVPVLTVCVVLYTAAKLYTMFGDQKRKTVRGVGANEQVNDKPGAVDHSETERRIAERVSEDYNYVSYDEISKGMNKSPTHSYVYDVTWL